MLDEDSDLKIQSLNKKNKEKHLMLFINGLENKSAKVPIKIYPLDIFITGKGGCQ